MSSPATPTPQQIFGNLLSTLKAETLANLKTPLLNAATAIKNNPTGPEFLAQGVALQGALIGQLPTEETEAIAAGAEALIQLINLIP